MSKSSSSQNHDQRQAQARRRAELIVKVRSGLVSASAAAVELGVSRKTYYEWENRGLNAMMAALEDRPTGRPKKPPDAETQVLEKQVNDLERKLAESERTVRIREMLSDLPGLGGSPPEPKEAGDAGRQKKGRRKRWCKTRKRKS